MNENLDRGRRMLEVLSQGDFDGLTAMTHPDVEWRSFFAE